MSISNSWFLYQWGSLPILDFKLWDWFGTISLQQWWNSVRVSAVFSTVNYFYPGFSALNRYMLQCNITYLLFILHILLVALQLQEQSSRKKGLVCTWWYLLPLLLLPVYGGVGLFFSFCCTWAILFFVECSLLFIFVNHLLFLDD